jgi:hypothetical protein
MTPRFAPTSPPSAPARWLISNVSSKDRPTTDTDVLVALMARPTYADLATLIAMADTDETVRLRILQAIRDIRRGGSAGIECRSKSEERGRTFRACVFFVETNCRWGRPYW